MPKFSKDILDSFRDRDYRHKFIQSLLAKNISHQVRKLRKDKDWTQVDLAQSSDKPQSVISRIESVGYGKLTLKTIYDISKAFDVAVMIRFVSFSDFIRGNRDLSWEALSTIPFEEDDISSEALYQETVPTEISEGSSASIVDILTILKDASVPGQNDSSAPPQAPVISPTNDRGLSWSQLPHFVDENSYEVSNYGS